MTTTALSIANVRERLFCQHPTVTHCPFVRTEADDLERLGDLPDGVSAQQVANLLVHLHHARVDAVRNQHLVGAAAAFVDAADAAAALLRLNLLEDDIRQHALLAGSRRGERGERLLVLRRQLHVFVILAARVVRRTSGGVVVECLLGLASENPRAPRRGDRVVLVEIFGVGILLVDGGHERPAERRGRRGALTVVVARLNLFQLLPRLQ